MNKLINKLKEEEQDFEFYPTTEEIIQEVGKHIKKIEGYARNYSLLDIGAGNGKVLNRLNELLTEGTTIGNKYAIEKSKILCESLSKDIFVVGTDFSQQTLIDKKVDIIFCNPPYKEFEIWVEKIIKQANCKYIYLVIPERWKNSDKIQLAMKARDLKHEVISSHDFLNSEDRKARAKVDVVFFKLSTYENDSFSVWFDEHFKFDTHKDSFSDYEREKEAKEKIHAIVKKENLIFELEKFYNTDMQELLKTYQTVQELSPTILKELDVNVKGLREGLRLKIEGLKNVYWKELFDNLDSITDRLTSDSRKSLLNKLMNNTSVDFTADNAFAVVLWVIKNANDYFDKQLTTLYMRLSDKENIIPYKSNKHFVKDDWRYSKSDMNNYQLDYRIITQCYNAIQQSSYGWDYTNNLSNTAHELISDIFTIAKNLGFNVDGISQNREWKSGKAQDFYCGEELFASIKAFKNGNLHLKLDTKFMKKFNIEASRLNGWIKTAEEAVNEFTDLTIEEALGYFGSNLQIGKQEVMFLTDSSAEVEHYE